MRIVSAIPSLRRVRAAESRPIELVPTLGALHLGHLSLLERARAAGGAVWMTLFVNPLQFGASEDLATYPRPLERDLELADQAGVDLVFTPTVGDLYPPAFASYVEPTGAATRWEGESRPGHFRGVATVVAILFRLCQPRRAYFGEKDYQQLQVIRRLVRDLYLDVEVVPCPTIREPDGLAYSSRNAYLAAPARRSATVLYRALQAARRAYRAGERHGDRLVARMTETVAAEPGAALDYAAVVDPESLEPLHEVEGAARLLIAVHVAGVHLIDNMAV
jgi:pantoate--beta-alanine ligase